MVSTLTRILGPSNLDLAEDVVQEALLKALRQWPFSGVPDNPSAWLVQVAKNQALDVLRRGSTFRDKEPEIEKWDVVVRMNGQAVNGLADLYRQFETARKDDTPVVLVLKRWSTKQDHVYDYVERTVAIEDLEFIGARSEERVALQHEREGE